jgi:hypothetical protein
VSLDIKPQELNHVLSQSAKLVSSRKFQEFLQRDPSFYGILNSQGRFLLVNRSFLVSHNISWQAHKLGFRAGDVMSCQNAQSAAQGCGTHVACDLCPLRKGIKECVQKGRDISGEVTLSLIRHQQKTREHYEFRLEVVREAGMDLYALFLW